MFSRVNLISLNINYKLKIHKKLCTRVNSLFLNNLQKDKNHVKVTICGAAGHVGQPLCLLLKQSPLIDELSLYDITNNIHNLGNELNIIDTKSIISCYQGSHRLQHAVKDSKIVVIAVSGTRQSECSINAFDINIPIVLNIVKHCAEYCPESIIAIVTNPVNKILPVVVELLKKFNKFNKRKVFGVTSTDNICATTLYSNYLNTQPECVFVPVIGGFTHNTIVPIFSNAIPEPCEVPHKILKQLTENLISMKKNFRTHNYLFSSYSIARFILSMLKALNGEHNIVECAYISVDNLKIKYLATEIKLGLSGLESYVGIPDYVTSYEKSLLDEALWSLNLEIESSENYFYSDEFKLSSINLK